MEKDSIIMYIKEKNIHPAYKIEMNARKRLYRSLRLIFRFKECFGWKNKLAFYIYIQNVLSSMKNNMRFSH